jgi:hypothetical protein
MVGLTYCSVVVHLSVFHATLPRINSFIVDFSTGQIDLRVADRDIELIPTVEIQYLAAQKPTKKQEQFANPEFADQQLQGQRQGRKISRPVASGAHILGGVADNVLYQAGKRSEQQRIYWRYG